MKTTIKYFFVMFNLTILNIFICSSFLHSQENPKTSGAPLPPDILIQNATLNGIPFSYACGQIVNFPVNSLLEFDILFNAFGFPTNVVSYTFNPPLPPGTFTTTPALPHTFFFDFGTVHFSWITPAAYAGILNIIVSNVIYTSECHLDFDWVLPVELSSFASIVNGNDVTLNWSTISQTNNSGFDIERTNIRGEMQDDWNRVGFINGHGTTTTPNNYNFTDNNLSSGEYKYRLKQIDFNGNFEYHNLLEEVVIGTPDRFSLSQNYPNPFNPVTKIYYELPITNYVTLKVYNLMGKEVKTLVNENQNAGRYEVNFDGINLASGTYFYKLESENHIQVRKMILMK